MSDFLVSRDRVAYRMVGLEGERHPERVREVIDGLIRDFRRHPAGDDHGRVVYVPVDMPAEITDAWVERHLARLDDRVTG